MALVQIEASQFVGLVALVAALLAGIGIFGYYLVLYAYRLGKARLVIVDPDTRRVDIKWVKTKNGEADLGDARYLLEGDAALFSRYRTWIVGPPGWGVNFVFPTKAATIDKDLRLAAAALCNPQSYRKAEARGDWGAPLKANDEGDKFGWVLPVAIVGLACIIVVIGMLGFVLMRLGGLATAAAAASGGGM